MRPMAVLAVAGCVAAMASGCSMQAGKASGASADPRPSPARVRVTTARGAVDAVPWVARVAPAPAEPPPAPVPSMVAEFTPCAAAQLSGHAGGISMGAGNLSAYLVLTNTGTAPCSILGGPSSAVGVQADGSRPQLEVGTLETGAFNLFGPPVNLRPGQSADAVIDGGGAPGACADSRGYQLVAVMIGVGTTGAVRVPFPGSGPWWAGKSSLTLYACRPGAPFVTGFGVTGPSDTPPPSPLNVLTVSRSMPASLLPGSTADYTITLANPTGRAVALSPCPSYAQFILPARAKPGLPGPYYYLNCAAAPRIPAHGSVTFEMRIPVPKGSGDAKYGWQVPGTTLETGGVTLLAG